MKTATIAYRGPGASTFCLFASILWLTVQPAQAQRANPTVGEPKNHVVVVSLDGMAAFLLDDGKVSLPTVRKMTREGALARGGMTVSNPSVTWPNHTTLITGVRPEKHGVLANGVLVRGAPGVPVRIDPKRDHNDLVRTQTLVDLAHALGMTVGEINWPCTRNSPAYDDSFPDVPESLQYTTSRLKAHLLESGLLTSEDDQAFRDLSIAARDWVWTEAACHLIRERKPDLLLVHLLTVDSIHHTYGSQTAAGYTANAYVDLCLDRIVAATEAAGIAERTTFLVVSDHGFITTPKSIRPNVVFREQGWLSEDEGRITEARVHVVPEGGIGLVYCTNPTESQTIGPQVKELLLGLEGVADVILPDRFDELGIPLPREYQQAPDAVIAAADGYNVSDGASGNDFVVSNTEAKTSIGTHGFVSSDRKMNGLCVLWGNQIQAGVELVEVENIDIAPTIARLLGVPGLEADGQVLEAALKQAE
jgi:predicted AlkP superfamily pyrophosphatase or phosphodiesterase